MPLISSRPAKTTPYPWLETKKNPRAHELLLRLVQKFIKEKGWKGEEHSVDTFLRWRNRH